MTCEDVDNGEIVERYLRDDLSPETREEFEQHYFECDRCFGLLQTYRTMRVELSRSRSGTWHDVQATSWVRRWGWLPAAAVVVMTTSLVMWRSAADTPLPPDRGTPAAPAAPPESAPPSVILADLARVEPPAFVAGRLRGVQDEATARYEDAMRHYQQREYPAAAAGLAAAAKLDPEAPHILFFLGISHLMAAEPDAAIAALRRTIALGDSAFAEDAYFFLAKSYLQQRDVPAAERALNETIERRGERQSDAQRLLDQLRALPKTTP